MSVSGIQIQGAALIPGQNVDVIVVVEISGFDNFGKCAPAGTDPEFVEETIGAVPQVVAQLSGRGSGEYVREPIAAQIVSAD
jgi:hypothetical protein